MDELYIGLMSGTSMDGIDAALARFGEDSMELVAVREQAYPAGIRERLMTARSNTSLRRPGDTGDLDELVGGCFRDAALALLADAGVAADAVRAIGSHGQTLRHEPHADEPFSLQIGSGEVIARGTGITTVCDFRSADIARGGEGAPLAPAFHAWFLGRAGRQRVVLNIGGIANVTLLPADGSKVTGFDTGPGNTLLDAWIGEHLGADCDSGGAWAAAGSIDHDLLQRLLADPYFAATGPKSTGFEYFNLAWLRAHDVGAIAPVDVQATLCELSVLSIATAILAAPGTVHEVLVCGGGVHNDYLMQRLRRALADVAVRSTAAVGLDPDWVEAVAFAWLAQRRLAGLPGNLPEVTGASGPALLGTVYEPPRVGNT